MENPTRQEQKGHTRQHRSTQLWQVYIYRQFTNTSCSGSSRKKQQAEAREEWDSR
jgi:hypothetical protein